MSVYVDDMSVAFGRMTMCHMAADSTGELNRMADEIGVDRRWIQYQGTWKEHYDICLSKRALAVKYGAIEISQRRLCVLQIAKRIDTQATKARNCGGAA